MTADEHRRALGFLSVDELSGLGGGGVRVLDAHSTLISRSVAIGAETVLYPGVVVDSDRDSTIVVGEQCVLYPGCLLEARRGGRIQIGSEVELGPGGVTVRASDSEVLVLEDLVRLTGNCELTGACQLGRGAQILGPVLARAVGLGGGSGGHRWPNPDQRGAVLKGAGIADGITLMQGEVRSCRASFNDVMTERQSDYHPPRS